MNLNYSDPDDALVEVTCFDNPNHIRLPATNNNSIDSSTYNKRDKNKNGYVLSLAFMNVYINDFFCQLAKKTFLHLYHHMV